jgi:hypothetical protein
VFLRRAGAYGCERSLCVLRLTALRNADDIGVARGRLPFVQNAEQYEGLRSTRLGWQPRAAQRPRQVRMTGEVGCHQFPRATMLPSPPRRACESGARLTSGARVPGMVGVRCDW